MIAKAESHNPAFNYSPDGTVMRLVPMRPLEQQPRSKHGSKGVPPAKDIGAADVIVDHVDVLIDLPSQCLHDFPY